MLYADQARVTHATKTALAQVCKFDDSFTSFERLGRLIKTRNYLNAPRSEFHTDGRLRLKVELVASEARQQVRLADTRVADQHN